MPLQACALGVASKAQPRSARGELEPWESERHKCGASLRVVAGSWFFCKKDHAQFSSLYHLKDEEIRMQVWVAWQRSVASGLMGAIADSAPEGCKIRALKHQRCLKPPRHIWGTCLDRPVCISTSSVSNSGRRPFKKEAA